MVRKANRRPPLRRFTYSFGLIAHSLELRPKGRSARLYRKRKTLSKAGPRHSGYQLLQRRTEIRTQRCRRALWVSTIILHIASRYRFHQGVATSHSSRSERTNRAQANSALTKIQSTIVGSKVRKLLAHKQLVHQQLLQQALASATNKQRS